MSNNRKLKIVCPHCQSHCEPVQDRRNNEYTGRVEIMMEDHHVYCSWACDWCGTKFDLPANVENLNDRKDEDEDEVESEYPACECDECQPPKPSVDGLWKTVRFALLLLFVWKLVTFLLSPVNTVPTLDCGSLSGIGRTSINGHEYLIACPLPNPKDSHEEAEEAQGTQQASSGEAASAAAH